MKKILVIGATGAMGQYLVPKLSKLGYKVDGISCDDRESTDPNVTYFKCNFKENETRKSFLAKKYDAIVDFMIYPTSELNSSLPEMLDSTGHYIYLSSYRVYGNEEIPVRETSPRLLDCTKDVFLRNSNDYSIYKARGEEIVKAYHPERKNWTIIRPAITYSFKRSQLVTLEMPLNVVRAFAGKKVVVPETARNIQATMSWGGDVAEMIARLLFNDKAYGEVFTVATSEHHTWGEIADYYRKICNLEAVWVPEEDFLKIMDPNPYGTVAKWQLQYDRLYSRVMDNTKILAATGMKQSELMPLFDGLKYEIGRFQKEDLVVPQWIEETDLRMDDYLAKMK